jgi:hypothetical protein
MANIPTLEQILDKFCDGDRVIVKAWDKTLYSFVEVTDTCQKEQLLVDLKANVLDVIHMRVWRVDSNYGATTGFEPIHRIWVC